MGDICLGAYATLLEAQGAMGLRTEPVEELQIFEDGDTDHPHRVWWSRAE